MKRMHRFIVPLLAAVASPAFASNNVADAVPVASATQVEFEVYLPLRDTAGLQALLQAQQTEGSSSYHKWLTPAQFGQRFGPTADTLAKAKVAAEAAGMTVTKVNTRSIRVSGTVGATNKLLGTSLGTLQGSRGASRLVAMNRPTLSPALQALGARVVSFSTVVPHRPMATLANAKALPANRYGPTGPHWFTDTKQAYDYPAYGSSLPNGQRLDGTGVSVALLMADLLYPNDVANLFNHEKFTTVSGTAVPTVATVVVNGGGVQGGYGSFEASLDVQQVLGGAPGANVTLVSLPSLSDDNITDGYNYIVNSNAYDVVSSSFGECELFYTADYNNGVDQTSTLQTYEEIFQQGNAQGITFFASSGDNGGLECTNVGYIQGSKNAHFIKGVSVPAASQYVTAVGGGNLVTVATSGSLDSTYVRESAYGDPLEPYDPYETGGLASGGVWGAGGGQSTIFARTPAQSIVKTGSKSRTVPDVGMLVGGCPGIATSCNDDDSAGVVAYNGKYYGVIGTSLSSPQFAGAFTLYVQQNGRQGDANYFLYKQGRKQTVAASVGNTSATKQFYHRDIPGNDGVYTDTFPSQNYNYINGNGTPDVRALFGWTKLYAPAGVPQTTTNP